MPELIPAEPLVPEAAIPCCRHCEHDDDYVHVKRCFDETCPPTVPAHYKCCDHCCHEYDGPPHLNPCAEGCNDDED